MSYTVTYTQEAQPDDKEFTVIGLGILVNGKPYEIDEAQERRFILETRKTIAEAFEGNDAFKVEGSTEVKEGVKGVLGIELSEISDTPEEFIREDVVVEEPVKPVATGGFTVTDTAVTSPGAQGSNANND